MKRAIVMAVGVVLALIVAVPMATAQKASHSKQDLGKLGAEWEQWALERPAEQDPNIGSYSEDVPPGDIKCDGSNPTKVWFLAQSFEKEVTRDCTAPAKTPIFFPVAKVLCSPAVGDSGDLRQCAKDFMDQILAGENESYAKVDGKAVKIQRAASELFTLTLPDGNPTGVEAGEYPAATDGLWVLLPSLPKGEHEVEFVSAFKDTPFGDLPTRKRTYNLTVE